MAKEEKKSEKEIELRRPSRMVTPFEEMDRWFEGFFPRGWMRPFHTGWPSWSELGAHLEARAPKVDVIDREEEVVVRAEVPGVDKDDLDVSVSDSAVTIKGKSKQEEKEEKGDYYRCEISSAAFARTVPLPSNVDTEKVTACFKDGVLELTMPKIEKARRRSVKID